MELLRTLSAIELTSGYSPNRAFLESEYSSLVAPYEVQEELPCCYAASEGHVCNTKHKHGWVVRLKDGTTTLLGRDCARDKFSANDEVFARDLARGNNALTQLKGQNRLAQVLSSWEESQEILSKCATRLSTISIHRKEVEASLGQPFLAYLIDMARRGNGSVNLTGIRTRRAEKTGDILRTYVDISAGRIVGLPFFTEVAFNSISQRIKAVHRAHNEAIALAGQSIGAKRASDLAARIGDAQQIPATLDELENAEKRFSECDLSSLMFLTENPAERARLIQAIAAMRGESISREVAKARVQKLEASIKASYSVGSLRMPRSGDLHGRSF